MSTKFTPHNTNRTPWTDSATLISATETEDAAGYITRTESEREVFCTFTNGVGRTEYYEAMKAGVQVSATVELWEDDYEDERILEYGDKRYSIGRCWPTGRGTLELYLTEVWR
jgi:hypothetical protein